MARAFTVSRVVAYSWRGWVLSCGEDVAVLPWENVDFGWNVRASCEDQYSSGGILRKHSQASIATSLARSFQRRARPPRGF